MTESRKRSRKSKLEIRDDDCDYEIVSETYDETTAPPKLQKLEPKIEFTRVPLLFDHDYCKPGYQDFASPYYLVRGMSGKAAVKQAASNMEDSTTMKFAHDAVEDGTLTNTEENTLHNSELTTKAVSKTNRRLVKKQLRTRRKSTNKIQSMKMLKYNPERLFDVSAEISSRSSNPADKVLDIEIRNLWGNILQTPDTINAHESMVQMALNSWQVWVYASKGTRDCPLFYQCHICDLAWWRLQQFREHLQIHEIRTMKVVLKENLHQCMLVASFKAVSMMKFIEIEEDCWRCGNDVNFHKITNSVYKCARCLHPMPSCQAWSEHDAICMYSNENDLKKDIKHQCTVCKRFMDSEEKLHEHMMLSHMVRSDQPVMVLFKECTHCDGKYFTYSAHNCPKSAKNSSCEHCCRKFATKSLALSHILSQYNRPLLCRFCGKQINTKCQEMEHIAAKHSNNYKLAYRCTICSNQNILYIDEDSVRKHKIICHNKKIDRRRCFYELMLVPKICLETDGMEVLIQSDVDLTETEQSSLPVKKTKTVKDIKAVARDTTSKQTSQQFPHILTVDVNVTVDEVDIKKEPIEYGENGEVDYEEMLFNMFRQDKPQQSTETGQDKPRQSKEFDQDKLRQSKEKRQVKPRQNKIAGQDKPRQSKEFDQYKQRQSKKTQSPDKMAATMTEEIDFKVMIKTEPVDDIDIVEHPVEVIQIKSEPIDESEEYFKYLCQSSIEQNQMDQTEDPETLTVKVEPDINIDEMHPEDIIIKNEIDSSLDNISPEPTPFDKLFDFSHLNSSAASMNLIPDEVLNPDESFIEVTNPSGMYKRKKVYACHKCGYTAEHKQYKVHITSNCSVSPGVESHPCTKCGLKFIMFSNYVLHFDTHGYEAMTCPQCREPFESLVKLLSHVQKHIKGSFVGLHLLNKGGEESTKSKQQVKCQQCREVLNKNKMFIHWENHLELKKSLSKPAPPVEETSHEEPELVVDCERVTMNNKKLDKMALKIAIEHLQSSTMNDKECVVCYRAFNRRYDVKRHLVEHLLMDAHMNKAKHKSFRCQICFEDFHTTDKYKFHMREHASMPIFKCELCNKAFSDSSNFAKHKKTHNVRVMICDICRKKFHSRAALVKHIAEHSSALETQCAFCDAKFVDKLTYKRHKYQAHTKHKFKCILCDLSFTCLQQKWDHDWEVHKERKQNADCPICLKSFRKLQDVRTHARTEHAADLVTFKSPPQVRSRRTAECPACHTMFVKLQDLRAHVRHVHRSDIRIVNRNHRRYEVKIIPD